MVATRNIAQAWSAPAVEGLRPTPAEGGNENPVNRSDLPIPNLLVVDDDPVIREQLERVYLQSGYSVVTAASAEEGIRRLAGEDVDFVVTDIKLPGIDGVQFVSYVHQTNPDLPVIAITGYADIQIAVDVLKLGATDFVMKPFDLGAVLESTRRALDSAKLPMEVRHLRRWLKERFQFSDMLSQTPEMHRVFELIRMAAPTDMTVLIHGETGTGKELVANAIHHHSERRSGPFVAINCAGFPESLLESELFGHEKGAFTGAHEAKQGKIALADRGTLFLDEIESMSLAMQGKMLRVLEERKVWRLGGSRSMDVDMRVIAASNISLKDMMAEGKLRADFYYRINVVPIHLIPLRKRSVDIPLLVQNFLHRHPVARSKKIVDVSTKVMEQLLDYSWPGNIRELQNVLECAILLAHGRIIEDVSLPHIATHDTGAISKTASVTLRQWLREKEKDFLSQKLADLGGNVGLTAKMCRIGVRTLSRKMRLYGLDKKPFREKDVKDNPFGPTSSRSQSTLSNHRDS